jgi:hypothetical protein
VKKVLVAVCLFVNGSCGIRKLCERVDNYSFQLLGGTFFSNHEGPSIKEVLLGVEKFLDHNIILEGRVLEIGSHQTYLILEEDLSKLLIVTVDLEPNDIEKESRIKVVGVVQNLVGNYPILRAKSLRRV